MILARRKAIASNDTRYVIDKFLEFKDYFMNHPNWSSNMTAKRARLIFQKMYPHGLKRVDFNDVDWKAIAKEMKNQSGKRSI